MGGELNKPGWKKFLPKDGKVVNMGDWHQRGFYQSGAFDWRQAAVVPLLQLELALPLQDDGRQVPIGRHTALKGKPLLEVTMKELFTSLHGPAVDNDNNFDRLTLARVMAQSAHPTSPRAPIT